MSSKLKPLGVGAAKASLNRASSSTHDDPKPGDLSMRRCGNTHWRTEPITVEKVWDDLWIGVKGQSNLEIAGSPRNLFR